MKKFVFFAVVLLCVGCTTVGTKQEKGKTAEKQAATTDVEYVAEGDDEFRIETLSDKDFYFKADTVLPNNSVIRDMVDAANSYAILRAAYCDAELWFRFGGVVNDEIVQAKTDIIKDKGIRSATKKYVKTLVNILPRDTAMWNQSDSVLWDKVWNAYKKCADRLSSRFALNHYGRITEKDVMKYMDIEQFIPNYDSLYELRSKQSEENERCFLLMAEYTSSFDRKCLYTVEYAHQCRYTVPHPAIPMLEELMKSGQFSRYLHEVWRTWRCLKQIEQSPSRDGMILNLEYNQMRYRCLNTILRKIIKNPKDIKAINDFLFLATYDNIVRFNEFPYGNSANLELMMLFPEVMDDE